MNVTSLAPWFCVRCAHRDRKTVRHAPASSQGPIFPCAYGHHDWSARQWYCLDCHREGRTTIAAAHERPVDGCARGHKPVWLETLDSIHALGWSEADPRD